MDAVALILLAVLLAIAVREARGRRALQKEIAAGIHLLRVDTAAVLGGQARLGDDYRAVHALLQQIRDLNTAELQERKEILQHENVSASSRVLQVRRHIADLEDAARRELEGLKHG